MKRGDKVYCKKGFKDIFIMKETYIINHIESLSIGIIRFWMIGERVTTCFFYNNMNNKFGDYFISLKVLRREKLKKLCK